jgi:pseudouridylate synthase I
MRIRLTIAYQGTNFNGWQTQAIRPGSPEQPTIQTHLMCAVERITGARVHVHGAGRTDSGVHALAQVAHMDVPELGTSVDWVRGLNRSLPSSIRVVRAEPVPDDFHAQHSATGKTYCYALWLDRRCTPPFIQPFVWNCGPVDGDAMERAARLLPGRHDFASLRNAGTDVESTIRTVTMARREPDPSERLRLWRFEGDGFLKQMVRNMMGLLVQVGRGKVEPGDVPDILAGKSRAHGGVTAPACGLCLYHVRYPDNPEPPGCLAPWWW